MPTVLLSNGLRTILAAPASDSTPLPTPRTDNVRLILCATSETQTFLAAAEQADEETITSYDAGDQPHESRWQAARAATIVTGRANFFEKRGDYLAGVRELLAGGTRLVAVTFGREPIRVHTHHRDFTVTPPQVTALDTTGCGDVFHAVLAGRLAMGWTEHASAADAANIAATHAATLGNAALLPAAAHGHGDTTRTHQRVTQT